MSARHWFGARHREAESSRRRTVANQPQRQPFTLQQPRRGDDRGQSPSVEDLAMSEAAPQSPLITMRENTAAYRRAVDDMLSRPARPGNSKAAAEKNSRTPETATNLPA